jgi:hypothetical protein
MKITDEQKHELLSSMPNEIPQQSRYKIIEFIEKITDLFEEDELTIEHLSQFGIACTITSQVLQSFASKLINDIEKNLKSETMH